MKPIVKNIFVLLLLAQICPFQVSIPGSAGVLMRWARQTGPVKAIAPSETAGPSAPKLTIRPVAGAARRCHASDREELPSEKACYLPRRAGPCDTRPFEAMNISLNYLKKLRLS